MVGQEATVVTLVRALRTLCKSQTDALPATERAFLCLLDSMVALRREW